MIHAFFAGSTVPGSTRSLMYILSLIVSASCLWLSACGKPETPKELSEAPKHVLLVTAQGLRSDVIATLDANGKSITPHLDSLLVASQASGTALSPSSDTKPAMASLVTGLNPWQHQVLHEQSPQPARQLYSLAESFRDRGFETTAVTSGSLLQKNPGFLQGFRNVIGLRREARVRDHLAGLSTSPTFTWAHIAQPQPPYFRSRADRRSRRGRILLSAMEAYRNPATALPEKLRSRYWQGYLRHVSWLDKEVGEILEALRSSGRWDETLILFVSLHGEEFGEYGQIGHGNNLGRHLLEVPWALKLPTHQEPTLLKDPQRPSLGSLLSTMLALSGSSPPPALPPSLVVAEPGDEQAEPAALSELYLGNGVNQFSLQEGDYQLIRTVRFARPERRYYLARRQLLGDPRVGPGTDEPRDLLARLEAAFDQALPFSAPASEVETRLYQWTAEGVAPVEDSEIAHQMSQRLAARWGSFLDAERSPALERRHRRGDSPAR